MNYYIIYTLFKLYINIYIYNKSDIKKNKIFIEKLIFINMYI